MKENKFRSWDEVEQELSKVIGINFDNQSVKVFCPCCESEVVMRFDEITLMQYTGLKDSTVTEEFPEGIEIYENDILYDPIDDNYFIVTWDNCYANFFLKNEREDKTDYDFAQFDIDVCHSLYVVGNTFENPELLSE